jgi:peptidoglycan hydrolase-like protein with peptidoglycan-binding domain
MRVQNTRVAGWIVASLVLFAGCGSDTKETASSVGGVELTAAATEPATQAPAAPANTWPVLTVGASSQKVRVLQYLLLANKITVSTDGKFGPKTGAALAEFAKQKGLPADASTTQQVWEALAQPVTTSSPGSAVRALQVALTNNGQKVAVSGVLNEETSTALAKVRADAGSAVTGEATAADWLTLLGEAP